MGTVDFFLPGRALDTSCCSLETLAPPVLSDNLTRQFDNLTNQQSEAPRLLAGSRLGPMPGFWQRQRNGVADVSQQTNESQHQ